MGGIVIGTVLTLLFLPALYVAWFRIPRPDGDAKAPATEAAPAELGALHGASPTPHEA
jgi:hypothetical protein